MRPATRRDRRPADDGFTLVELIVYMMLAGIVFTIVATIMINSFRVDSQVRSSAASASTTQLLVESLGRGIRNAGWIELTTPAPGQTYVRTQSRDSGSTGTWVCDGWLLDGGTVKWTSSATALPSSPDATALTTWVELTDSAEQVGSAPILSLAADRRSLTVLLITEVEGGAPVRLDTTIFSRQPRELTTEERAQCFGTP